MKLDLVAQFCVDTKKLLNCVLYMGEAYNM